MARGELQVITPIYPQSEKWWTRVNQLLSYSRVGVRRPTISPVFGETDKTV